jgi:NAD(P)-dependent dehydrogenase (short-subunit alcohol dehydrogenase family)
MRFAGRVVIVTGAGSGMSGAVINVNGGDLMPH